MVLEATVLIIDNSEWTRNGDYSPSRLAVQQDATQLICNTKRAANVESTLAILTMAGKSPSVGVTLTGDAGKLSHCIASIGHSEEHECCVASSLQVAQLILKNRQNAHQRQRIIVFVASPIAEANGKYEAIGKMLKKNNVQLDVVSLGAISANRNALKRLICSASGVKFEDGSQDNIAFCESLLETGNGYLEIEKGEDFMQCIRASSLLMGDDEGGFSGGGYDGMDEDMDPELAMALKLSLEEEQNRNKKSITTGNKQDQGSEKESGVNAAGDGDTSMAVDEEDDEEMMLARAIAMSMEQQQQPSNDNDQNKEK